MGMQGNLFVARLASIHRRFPLMLTCTIEPESTLAHLLEECVPLKPEKRALALEGNTALECAYASIAKEGDTEAPRAEDEVDFHYFCFVKSHSNGHLFLLDGDRKRPIDLGDTSPDEDVLSGKCLDVIRDIMARGQGKNLNFNRRQPWKSLLST